MTQTAAASANPWEPDILRFEEADRVTPPPAGAVLFVGSSSIALWHTLAQDFPATPVINRGFGGSQLADSVEFAGRIVTPYRPRFIVVYAGDNDLAGGKSPEQVAETFRRFVQVVRTALPGTPIAFVAIKPSLARWALIAQIRDANARIERQCRAGRGLHYVDIATPMLGADGKPRPELFVEDGLHLSRAGYDLWKGVIAPYLPPAAGTRGVEGSARSDRRERECAQ